METERRGTRIFFPVLPAQAINTTQIQKLSSPFAQGAPFTHSHSLSFTTTLRVCLTSLPGGLTRFPLRKCGRPLKNRTSLYIRLCTTLNLVDPWLQICPETQTLATHERGTNRIDSMFVSQSLLPQVLAAGYSPVCMLSSSDHRSVFLSFSSRQLFGDSPI